MARAGISVLVDSPLRDLVLTLRETPTDLKRQIGQHTRNAARPIWTEELKARASTRLQHRVIVASGAVGVSATNVTLKAGGKGRVNGTPTSALIGATEFGMSPDALIDTRSRKGTPYKRRAGGTFLARRRQGYVAFPASRDSISRFASLWVQTAYRTFAEAIEKA